MLPGIRYLNWIFTIPGACSIPSHLRVENMQKFLGIPLDQAASLAKIYRILDLGYADVAIKKIGRGDNRMTLNHHIRKFIKAEQSAYVEEFIAYDDGEDQAGNERNPEEDRNLWMSMNGEHYSILRDDEDRERQWDQTNPVNLYTYNNMSQIPAAVAERAEAAECSLPF